MFDIDSHPFSPANIAYESGADTPFERQYYAWCAKVEAILGHDLDGNDENEAGAGYSLDEALAYFEAGDTPAEYAAEVQSRARYTKPEA